MLDTSAVLAFLWSEPGEEEVVALLREGACVVPAGCLSEIVDQLIRRGGNPPSTLSEKLAPLLDEIVAIPATDAEVAWRAGELRARHYDRRNAALSPVDCLLLAAAGPDDRIATADGSLARVAAGLGVGVVLLPDSRGRRPKA